MYLFVNDINRTDTLHRNSISISDELQQRLNSASFVLSGSKPDYFDEVKVYEGFPILSYAIDSIVLKKNYWEAIQNNLFRIGDVIYVDVPNSEKHTIVSIDEEEETPLEYTYLDVDTTATGSTVAFSEDGVSYTTVADGGSITIDKTFEPEIYVKSNITANRLYLSSNDYNAVSAKDGSLRETVGYNSPDSGDTSIASRGGLLINIDSATGDIAQTSSGVIEDEKYGFFAREFAASTSAEFDSAVTRTGRLTLKMSTLDATGYCRVLPHNANNYSTVATNLANSAKFIPVKASTKYRMRVFAKTNNAAASSVFFDNTYIAATGTGTYGGASNVLSGTNDWTLLTREFTTSADAVWLGFTFYIGVVGNISDAWFDVNSMTLEEVVEPVANSLNNVSPSIQSFTAVGSTDNIDQSQLSTTNSVSFSNVAQHQAQQIITTKSKFVGITFYKKPNVGSPTGTMTFKVVNDSAGSPGTTVYASYVMSNATYLALSNNAEFTVSLPCNIPTGTYWTTMGYSVSSATDYPVFGALNGAGSYTGLYKYGTDGVTYGTTFAGDCYFKTLYYKPTTNFKASQNNTSISISADEDGFQYGSVLDLTTGTYSFATPYSNVVGTTALLNQILCYSQTGLMTQSTSTDINWRFAHTIIFKVKIPLYTTGRTANLIFGTLYNTTGQTVTYSYSYDNVTYYTAQTDTTAGLVSYLPGGLSIPITNNSPDGTLYIRYNNSGGDNRLYWVGMNTTIDTSTIPTLYNYPTNKDLIRTFGTRLGTQTTTATYRKTKYGFPAIEWLPLGTSSPRKTGNLQLTLEDNISVIGDIAGRKRFAGNIVDISDSNKQVLGNIEYDVTALDYTRVFDKKLINDTYTDRDARYIVNDFCNSTINRNIEIEEFNYANTTALRTKWTNNPTLNTSDYREGNGCMTFSYAPAGTGSTVATLTAINASEIVGGRIGLWYNVLNATSVRIEIGSSSANYVHTTFTPEIGWVYFDKLISEMTTVGTPNFASITHLKVQIVSTGSATINVDGIRILESEFYRHYPHVQESIVFDDFRINRVKPAETMQRLADSLEWYWFVDYDRNIWLFPNTTIIAPIDINETSNNFANLSISYDTSRLINRQVVRGGEETSTSAYSQVIEGNSVAREWIMKNKFKNLSVKLNDGTSTDTMEAGTTTTNVRATGHGLVTGDYIINRTRSNAVREVTYVDANNFTVSAVTGQTNGDSFSLFVSQNVGVEGINVDASYDYMSNYNEKSIRSAETEPTLTSGQFLLFQYNEVIPILVQRTDNTSMMLMRTVLGFTDGIFDGQPIVDQTITSRSEAIQVAEAVVNKYSNVVITATFTTEQEGLEAGQLIRIKDTTSSTRNIDQDFLIQSVKCRQIEWGNNRYSVTCSSLLFGMLELLQQLLANNRKIKVNEDEVINNIEDGSEILTLTDVLDTNIDGEINTETILIADTLSTDVVEPPFYWGPTGLASEFQWEEAVWS